MSLPENPEVAQFLREHMPFSSLSDEELQHAASQIEVAYFKAGSEILSLGGRVDALHVIRSGAVEVFRRNGSLYNRLSEGGIFGEFGLLRNGVVRFPARALEDSLVYLLPEPIFNELFEANEEFADYVEVEDRTRLRQAVSQREDANDLMNAPVRDLVMREPVTVSAFASAQEAAQKMVETGMAALLITDTGQAEAEAVTHEPPTVVGIVTDRDLRDRLVAEGRDYSTPVAQIMSPALYSIESNQLVFEAMLVMLQHNVHHLPVMRRGVPLGMVDLTDIIRYESQNSLFVVSSIHRQMEVETLSALSADAAACFRRMVTEDANSRMIGSAMAVIGRSFKQRLLELAEEILGPPPVPYCFVALGSMARDEQALASDQDNALILDDSYDEAQHGDYFEALAKFVCDGLNACGYSYCSGEVMATNPRWRQPRRVWQRYFDQWIEQPTPETLLNSSIFFDIKGVWGEVSWADQLYRRILDKARRSPRFLASMARNALLRTPPLGFFKDFVMETDGRHGNSINIKRRGTAPLVDLIRVHALAVGSEALNSFERLDDIIAADILPRGRGQDLRDALEFISLVRIRHQALDLDDEREPDNNIEPENLSEFERKHLKDAFQLLSDAQKYLRFRYTPGR
ncbi:cyclic nucleotide-binding/CBS domain-containing protein [Motiliproteus coralliicola]|uniref:Cyclic nucleotide-binding/CBS domain-containing protein n=1 Tax=Motiliproteus coralliicola TaxID=2283196 RepID=A0A369WSX8_9GAMM|nr:DUF294 nucleotidyltransferase-like domain-containing protein [Motiliproteus coralliicola]RDE22595.1 cyclic nucleotide-binding/CBS domain-containing protein [Motiliproteus coralliicola]